MNKIVNYKILAASTVRGLTPEVNRHMAEGWQPLGGALVDEQQIFQTMVQYEEKDEEL